MKILKSRLFNRFIQVIVALFGISLISFLITYLSPVDPVRAMFAVSGQIPSEEMLQQMRIELGLNKPFYIQYVNWFMNCIHGDFGTSFTHGEAVSKLLLARLLPTINLALLASVIMIMLALPLGILSAVNHNSKVDYALRFVSFIQISMPNFWVGLLLLYFFALKLGLVSVVSSSMGFEKIFLPALTLALAMSGKYARQVRTSILEELNQDYVIGARSRGISERVILWKHILPNAMLPLITLLGLSLGSLLGGTAVVEVIFSYPALGSLALSAIKSMDYPLIQGFVLWIALVYMTVNIIVDVFYEYLDPRLRKGN